MESIGVYLLQMSCWLAGFWLVYFFFLKKETHYRLNRWFLLTGMVLSLVIPFIPIQYEVVSSISDVSLTTGNSEMLQEDVISKEFTLTFWLQLAYLLGIVIFIIRFIYQVYNLKQLRKRSELIIVDNAEVYQLEKETAPFSFFNKIYVSKSLCDSTVLKTVVIHEKVHIEEYHWVDLLFFELSRTLQWFNPLMFVYRKAIMENHEYLADNGAIDRGIIPRNYQAILVNQMFGMPVIQMVSSFTMFNPSKRITMMKKDKSKPIRKLKILWALPVIALLMVAFAEPVYTYPTPPSDQTTSDKLEVHGRVVDTEGEGLPGTSIVIANSTNGTLSDKDGKFSLAGVNPNDEIVFSFVGFKNQKVKAKKWMTIKMEKRVVKIVSPAKTKTEDAPPPPPPPPSITKEGKEIVPVEEDEKEVFIIVEEMPEFKGGKVELDKYITKATANAKEKGIVRVGFNVNAKGNIGEIKIIDSPSETLSKQAYQIMKEMPAWNPGMQRGKPVTVSYVIQINF